MAEAVEGDARIVSRLLFFSDAVFAIVLTLLVLELRPPHIESEAAFWPAMQAMAPRFTAFAASFSLVAIFWAAHMTITRRLSAFDWPVAWVNMVFLFTIALMPFGSAMIGESGVFGNAWRLYCGILIAASLTQTLLLLFLMRGRGRLVGGTTMRERAWRVSRGLSPGIAFGVGLWLSLVGEPRLASLCWALIPVLLVLGRLLFGPRKAAPRNAAASA